MPRFFGILLMFAGGPGIIAGILLDKSWVLILGAAFFVAGLWSFATMTFYRFVSKRNEKQKSESRKDARDS